MADPQTQNGAMQQAPPAPAQQRLPLQQPHQPRQIQAAYVAAITAAIDIASVRMLGFLGVIGALIMFGYATYDPTPIRLWTVGIYAAVVLWPLVYLYVARGQPT
jgi:hypothetical protein